MEAIYNVKIRELLFFLSRMNTQYELCDIILDANRNSITVNPVQGSECTFPVGPNKPKKEEDKTDDKIDRNIDFRDLLGS